MTVEEKIKALQDLSDSFYKVCRALVNITYFECCDYGFHEAVDIAEKYVINYERDHPDPYEGEE